MKEDTLLTKAFEKVYEGMMWSLLNGDYMFPSYVDDSSAPPDEREFLHKCRYMILDIAEQGIDKTNFDPMDRLYVMFMFLDKLSKYNPLFVELAYPGVRERIGDRKFKKKKDASSFFRYEDWHRIFVAARFAIEETYPDLIPSSELINHGYDGVLEKGRNHRQAKSTREKMKTKKILRKKKNRDDMDDTVAMTIPIFRKYNSNRKP